MNKPTQAQKDALKAKVAAMPSAKRVEIATKILIESDGKFEQSSMLNYLTDVCGLTMTEYLEALNKATDGELVKEALSNGR